MIEKLHDGDKYKNIISERVYTVRLNDDDTCYLEGEFGDGEISTQKQLISFLDSKFTLVHDNSFNLYYKLRDTSGCFVDFIKSEVGIYSGNIIKFENKYLLVEASNGNELFVKFLCEEIIEVKK